MVFIKLELARTKVILSNWHELKKELYSRCREIENCCHCETTPGRSNPNIKEF